MRGWRERKSASARSKKFIFCEQRTGRRGPQADGRRRRRSFVQLLPLYLSFHVQSSRVIMMDYKAYERKMNSIYDMVGEGKYKVRGTISMRRFRRRRLVAFVPPNLRRF